MHAPIPEACKNKTNQWWQHERHADFKAVLFCLSREKRERNQHRGLAWQSASNWERIHAAERMMHLHCGKPFSHMAGHPQRPPSTLPGKQLHCRLAPRCGFPTGIWEVPGPSHRGQLSTPGLHWFLLPRKLFHSAYPGLLLLTFTHCLV